MMLTPFLCLALVAMTSAFPTADEILHQPGLKVQPSFKQYSGYLKATGPRQLHYWLVLSQNKPETDPLILWLNGGPGCSSMEGLLNENGPYNLNEDGKNLTVNPYSWNTVANVLYIEAPVGVGFSYTPEKSVDYNDDMAAEDNYQALKSFFKKFPSMTKNSFYITGESYAGIYVPTLSVKVMDDAAINFKGTAVGNGFNDAAMNENSLIYFAYYHGLLEHSTFNKLLDACNCSQTSRSGCDFTAAASSSKPCNDILDRASARIYEGGLNVYNLYADCVQASGWVSLYQGRRLINTRIRKETVRKYLMSTPNLRETPACVDSASLLTYMNSDAVKKAIHIPADLPSWDICSDKVGSNYKRTYSSTAQFYKKLLAAKKYKLLIYNGDVDMACNFLGDEWFTESLGQKVMSDFYPWHIQKPDGPQVAGYVKKYDGITFITVRGSGHMVPEDKPAEALLMLKGFLGIADL